MSSDVTESQNSGQADDNNDHLRTVTYSRPVQRIELSTHFPSFIALRNSLDKYQKENHVQLIVKDSKLLSAESTRRVIPKVYHLVNQSLMYHSITYCCKCHGALKQKPGSRIKNIGAKRLNCPMYLRFKLSSDLQSLVLFDMLESHNHPTDPNTFQLSPRQQIYRLSRIQRGESDPIPSKQEELLVAPPPSTASVQTLITSAIKDVNSVASLTDLDYRPPAKKVRVVQSSPNSETGANPVTVTGTETHDTEDDDQNEEDDNNDDERENDDDDESNVLHNNTDSPLDPDSSCSDSDEEEVWNQRHLLTYPMRLIGSAIKSSPELLALAKDLIETQKENLLIAKKKLLLETNLLELQNTKLSLEVKNLEKTLAGSSDQQPTTFYLQS